MSHWMSHGSQPVSQPVTDADWTWTIDTSSSNCVPPPPPMMYHTNSTLRRCFGSFAGTSSLVASVCPLPLHFGTASSVPFHSQWIHPAACCSRASGRTWSVQPNTARSWQNNSNTNLASSNCYHWKTNERQNRQIRDQLLLQRPILFPKNVLYPFFRKPDPKIFCVPF